jgi:signal transduction histidine kinase
MYFGEMLPNFTEVKDTVQQIIQINQENMVAADREAKALSRLSTRYMLLAIAVGLGGAAYFAARLQRAILQPIQTVTSVARDLGDGKLDQVVPVQSHDELGELADAFNKMATKLRAYRQVTSDQILQARQMTEITLSAFPDAIIALSTDGKISFTNPAAHQLLGKLDLPEILPPSVRKEADEVLKGSPDYLPTSFEHALVFRVNDHEHFLLPRIVAMRDEADNIFGVAVILQDVTRFRLLDDVKTNLVSTVSHELKTPLTSVRMGLHLLLEERIGTLNSKQTELLLAAREDSERLLRMINDMLDLAKLESGKASFPHQPIAAKELIDNAAADLRTLVESRGSRLLTENEPDLPAVSVDTRQMSHVFSNFVANAVKYTKPGDGIILKAKSQGSSVRFSVIDHGTGIPAQYQPFLFDRFYRVPGSESTGAGLGLAIAKEIVATQGGTIGVHSISGQGSEFYFDLPAAKPIPSHE